MKIIKKLMLVCLVLVLAFSLAACGGGEDKGKDGNADLLKNAQGKMDGVNSYHMNMVMDMGVEADGESQILITTASADCIADPLLMKMDMKMDTGETGSMDSIMYLETMEDGSITMYMSDESGDLWIKQSVSADLMGQYDAKANMELYLKSIENFKETGTEKINEMNAVRFDGVITENAMAEVLEASGTSQQLGMIGLGQGDFKDLGDIPCSIWIDKKTGFPVKYEMDMTKFMETMMKKMIEASGVEGEDAEGLKVTKMFISVEMSKFNEIKEIVIPEEARNAQGI